MVFYWPFGTAVLVHRQAQNHLAPSKKAMPSVFVCSTHRSLRAGGAELERKSRGGSAEQKKPLPPPLRPSIIQRAHEAQVDFHPAESLFRLRAVKWKRALAGSTQVSKRASEGMSEWVHEGFVRISARLGGRGVAGALYMGGVMRSLNSHLISTARSQLN